LTRCPVWCRILVQMCVIHERTYANQLIYAVHLQVEQPFPFLLCTKAQANGVLPLGMKTKRMTWRRTHSRLLESRRVALKHHPPLRIVHGFTSSYRSDWRRIGLVLGFCRRMKHFAVSCTGRDTTNRVILVVVILVVVLGDR
jgi:hypothetical protein